MSGRAVGFASSLVLVILVVAASGPPVTGAEAPGNKLLGKWQNAKADIGFEFGEGGKVTFFRYRRLPVAGTYKLVGADTLEWKFPEEKPTRYQFAVASRELVLTLPGKTPQKATFRSVKGFAAELNHPNRKPNERQRKWVVGIWRGVEREFMKEDVYRYGFYADGTFSVLKYSEFFHKTTHEMGTYRVHPNADNFLELTYPDTGKVETIYAEVGEKELALTAQWGFGKELRKHTRVEDKEPRARPVRKDALTAFALFRECAARPEASKKKYAGKEVEVVGSVGGHFSARGEAELYLITGASARVRCKLDTTDKPTAQALRQIALGGFLGRGVQVVSVRGKFEGIVKEEDRAAKLVGGVLGMKPAEKGPQLGVRLSGCKVVAQSNLQVK